MASAPQKSPSQRFQAPKGTRDFYPDQMAVRRYIEGVWRKTAINHGFDEIDGPTFEHLDLYTHKSGPGIVSEIFHVFSGKDQEQAAAIKAGGGEAPYALRPEFTPTLARMVAAKAAELPRPIKWFAIPSMFRAERPQRGRLREHIQWNVDFIGGEDNHRADAELIATAVAALETLHVSPSHVVVGYSNRAYVREVLLETYQLPVENLEEMFLLLDEGRKLRHEEFDQKAIALGVDRKQVNHFSSFAGVRPYPKGSWTSQSAHIASLRKALSDVGVADWCDFQPGIVRGLAYYTGTVFEIHEATGAERAIAGGGRYDNLIESFGGPSLPACGFGMGDVVLGNLLHDKGLLKEEHYRRDLRPDAFVIAADDEAAARLPAIVATLRREGLHARHSYKTTRNVGKLLGEAGKAGARFAVILGKELAEGRAALKNLQSTDQREVAIEELPAAVRESLE